MRKKEWFVAIVTMCLWLAFSPELFFQVGMGCFQRADGVEMSAEEAREVIDHLIFPEDEDEKIVIHTKSKILEWLRRKE